ncbi:MAG TPA: chitobiase/beta-hexosaminidase C-terminal domain-containing protein, partial [Spirochaetia bacterium]|nr:chitobiase/beta-hexosaminidase C-terminal domain-containing protein [Spirochaetia bacterium]
MSVDAPTFTPTSGTYNKIQSIEMSVLKPTGATIRYTSDGSDPTPSAGTLYTGPISLVKTATIKAIAYKTGWLNSKTASATYTMNLENRTFWVPNLDSSSSTYNTYYQDPAVLEYEGSHCLVYVEDSTISSVPLATAQAIASQFDTVIYPLDHTYFGTESDLDGNGKVILFILDIKDGYSASTGGGYVAGFFNPGDMLSSQSNAVSNEGEILYLDDNPANP